jgi:hypothetical protein
MLRAIPELHSDQATERLPANIQAAPVFAAICPKQQMAAETQAPHSGREHLLRRLVLEWLLRQQELPKWLSTVIVAWFEANGRTFDACPVVRQDPGKHRQDTARRKSSLSS